MRKIKINNEYVKVPTNWNHIDVDKFETVFLPAMNGDHLDAQHIVFTILDFDINTVGDSKVLDEILECVSFFNQEIQPNDDPIMIDGEEWELTDMKEITYFQAISIENIKKKNNFDISGYITVLLKPKNDPNFKYSKFDSELQEKIGKLPITHFYGSYILFYTFMTSMNENFKNIFKKKLQEELLRLYR